jgi:hypothetical protein
LVVEDQAILVIGDVKPDLAEEGVEFCFVPIERCGEGEEAAISVYWCSGGFGGASSFGVPRTFGYAGSAGGFG